MDRDPGCAFPLFNLTFDRLSVPQVFLSLDPDNRNTK